MTTTGQPAAAGPTTAPANGQSLSDLVGGIVDDAQTLIRQQVVMLRSEFKEDMRRTKDAARYMGLGAALTAVGGLFLIVSLVYFVQYLFPNLHLAACWAIVGGAIFLAGLAAVYAGKRKFDAFNPLPDKTAGALQENVSWLTNRQS